MTISTPGTTVDGIIAAVVRRVVEDGNGVIGLQSSDVEEVRGRAV